MTSSFGNSTKLSPFRWSIAAIDSASIPEKLNVNGGSIAIGHPFGMTGSRLVGTIANEMQRRKPLRRGDDVRGRRPGRRRPVRATLRTENQQLANWNFLAIHNSKPKQQMQDFQRT